MPVEVRLHSQAERELRAAYLWYLDRNVIVADAFQSEAVHSIKAVSDDPLRWPVLSRAARRYVFPRFPFSLVYRVRDDRVEVIAFAHHKRKPGYWATR